MFTTMLMLNPCILFRTKSGGREEAEGGEEAVPAAQAQLPANRRGAQRQEDHPVQRLHRGDPGARVRPTGGQTVDSAHAQGQGGHTQGAQRVQELRDGSARRQPAFN